MASLDDAAIAARLEDYASTLGLRDFGPSSESGDSDPVWTTLCADVEDALARNSLSLQTIKMAHAISLAFQSIARGIRNVESIGRTIQSDLHDKAQRVLAPLSHETFASKVTGLPLAHVRPILDYFSDHLCSPYPTGEQKQTLIQQCVAAGWTSVNQRKLEDWLNMARCKMGYTLVLRSDAVREDRQVMADYVRRVLSGDSGDCAGIPASIVRRIKMMQQWVHDQYESRAARDQTSSWAHDVVDLVQRLSVPDQGDASCSDDDEELSSDDFDCDESDDSDSDSDTLYSDSDDDTLPPSVVGAKRKYSGLGFGQPPSRMVSRTLSNSSLSSHGTLADLADREVSDTRSPTVQSDAEQDSDRPLKRRRSLPDGSSVGSSEGNPPASTTVAESPSANAQLTERQYRSHKRKRSPFEDDYASSPSQPVRQLDPLPSTQVPLADLDALSSICQFQWDASRSAAQLNVDVDDGLLINSPPLDDLDDDDLFDAAVTSCESPGDTFSDTSFAWCKFQVFVLERMLRHGVHIVPSPNVSPSPTDSAPSITVDASLFNSEQLAYLSSLCMQSPDVGQAYVEPPDLLEPGPICPGVIGMSPWTADVSAPAPSDGTTLPSVDIDEWIASLLNEPFST